ncbi:wax ester/triacylglycerol synthase family O-acyltransferase [Mycolicibacterium sp. S2-37]|uniref:WS/DGAT/MGAT family O-acyltransferase n=1 Tax=Mycolicibacterium sp. S2-37 TaxID=2810297 RepID=UPI001A951BBD|nr:wax ester/triacylglycerol synthase family O-acyltransferase [Mycolicibacterium sp. S2-37]MBO0680480.1 wax ester/triacylglycerol synthase family O-acyltransferase [Mycolicibacterium sp. S2-37]
MQRLSGLDASFLYLETPQQLLHVCSILELDTSTMPGGYTFAALREALEERVAAMPEFREKLADSRFNLDHPVWVDDDDFDIERHVHRIAVPVPGGREELSEIYGHIASQPLDRSRPLWEKWIIEGIDGVDPREGGRVAVLTKVHHAAVDGVTGASLMSKLCSTEPDAPAPEPVPGVGSGNSVEIAVTGAVKYATRPLKFVNAVPTTLNTVVDTVKRVRAGASMAAPFAAPKTAWNANVTGHRNIAWSQLDLEDIKTVKNHFGVKVNDVVMALVSGVLRKFLLDREELPESTLIAMVPVSVHDKSDRPGRNQVSGMFSRLETHIADPVERIKAIAGANSVAKQHSSAIGATLLQDWTQFAAPAVFGTAMRVYAASRLSGARPVLNLVVSNVPGPQMPLYYMGSEVKAMYPIGPVFHGAGLNITVMSLNGTLDVGIVSCPELLPDLWSLADDFGPALDELLDAVG